MTDINVHMRLTNGVNTVPNDRVIAAVNYLIDAADYSAVVQEMTRTIENWPDHGKVYTGKLASLNALVAVGVKNREAFENVIALVERKRLTNPKVSKRDYQRNIMRDRRKRMAKAILLHEARSGPLKGAARASTMKAIRARWDRAKAEYMVVNDVALTGAERLQAVKDFWATVDRQLDANIANLHKTQAVA